MRIYKLLLAGLFFTTTLLANANLYVFVFKDGKALQDTKIKVGEFSVKTNQYGYAAFENLPSDTYEVEYFKDDKIFALEEVNIVPNQDSQLFLTLQRQGHKLDLDLPLEAYSQDFKKVKVKKLEGPKGTLEFKLIDSKSKKKVKKAKLFFRGYQLEATSDEKGIVKIDIPRGKYDISIVHPNYVMKVIKDVEIKEKKTTKQETKLTKSDISLEEYVVLAPAVEGSLASTFAELKDSDVAGEALSAEQFSKSGDSSAAGALKRVTGITIVDEKYVYVRGLGERYSTVLLNNLEIPSPEITKRVVPLDIFPTGIIQSMNIQKTWTSDLPGTFGGGTIDITTKDIPQEDNYIKGSIGLSYNGSTGKNSIYSADNSKAAPAQLISMTNNFTELNEEIKIGNTVLVEGYTQEELDALKKEVVSYRRFGTTKKAIEPGKSVGLSLGQSFKTQGGLKYGFSGSLYYKTDQESKSIKKSDYIFQLDGTIDNDQTKEYETTKLKEKYGGLMSFVVDDQKYNKVKFTTLYLKQFDDLSVLEKKFDIQEDRYYKRTNLIYEEKDLSINQISGNHNIYFNKKNLSRSLFDDLEIDWGYEKAQAKRYVPGSFEYRYETDENYNETALDKTDTFIRYSTLDDKLTNYRVDLTLPYQYNNRDNYLQFGVFQYNKKRDFDNRWFKIQFDQNDQSDPIDDLLTEDNVDNGTINVTTTYFPEDSYIAVQDIEAFYIKQLFSLTKDVDISIGVRNEKSTQKLTTGDKVTRKLDKVFDPLNTSDTLPSIATTYRIDDALQLRASYAKSVSRPDFREFAEGSRYKDPITGDIYYGYGDLEYTNITNSDIKLEYYPSYDELISLALFQKDFIKPIETVKRKEDNIYGYSVRNAKSAKSVGVELGFRKKLTFLYERLSNYFISGNYAKIKSEVVLGKDDPENANDQYIKFLTTTNRPMQGQSPYVTNLQFGYDNLFTGRSAVFSYNEFGKRIVALGVDGQPDEYEQPFKKLDFTLKWRMNDTYDISEKKVGYTVSFKAKNLLDSEKKIEQGSKVIKSYKPGQSFNVSLSIKY
jgi:TonB-dependent receptor